MLVEERSAVIRVPQTPSIAASVRPRVPSGALALVGASVVVAALTLLLPSAPTYDPWAWIVWGREVAHLDLVTTDGPSWKPLPVLFTTVFSLFGSIAPDLWLVVARAGAIAAVLLAFRVTRRLGGGIVGGAAAAAALAIAPWWIRNAALGNSEGLLVAFLLGAIDRHLAGDRRAAFLLAACAGLLRPEAWPFLGLYGLWSMWRRDVPVALVVGTGAAVVALWLLPEWWGSGDLLRAAHRAKDVNPGAPTYADNPAIAVLRDAQEMLTGPLIAGLAAAVGLLVVRRSRAVAVLALLAAAWLALVADMTQDGFSGNLRYLIAPVALAIVLGGAGAGWLFEEVLRLARRVAHRPPHAVVRRAVVVAVAGVAAVAFAEPSFQRFQPNLDEIQYQANLADELPGLVAEAGGAAALKACGTPFTGAFFVPAVAWNLGLHTRQVALEPQRPAVVFRVRTLAGSAPVPGLRGLDAVRTLASSPHWRVAAACGHGAGA